MHCIRKERNIEEHNSIFKLALLCVHVCIDLSSSFLDRVLSKH